MTYEQWVANNFDLYIEMINNTRRSRIVYKPTLIRRVLYKLGMVDTMTKNSDTSPWMRFLDDPKAIKRHNELVLSSIPTADLVAELSKRDGVIVPHPDLWFGTINNEIKCGKSPKKVWEIP